MDHCDDTGFPKQLKERLRPGRLEGRGFGYNALVVATAFTLGPTVASGILAIGPWTWLFAVNIPFGLVAILIGLSSGSTISRILAKTFSSDQRPSPTKCSND